MESTQTHSRRFWTLYIAAWLPYALSYYVLFHSIATGPLLQTAYNILPAMLTGVLVVFWSGVLAWPLHTRRWFYPAQLVSALLYSLLWAAGVVLAGSVGNALRTGHFRMGMFGGYALQWQFFSGLMIYGNIVGASYVLQANASLHREERRREQAESLKTSAELSALRAQLNPHFLFNTLNSIVALAGPAQPRIAEAVSQLAAMLRYTLSHQSELEGVSLRQELAFTEQYLALEALRLGARLQVRREIDPSTLPCTLPPLTLQPLVENAIRHGIAKQTGCGTLLLRATLKADILRLEIEDDGAGSESGSLFGAEGLGIRTVHERLQLFSENEATLTGRTAPGQGCRMVIEVPQDGRFTVKCETSMQGAGA